MPIHTAVPSRRSARHWHARHALAGGGFFSPNRPHNRVIASVVAGVLVAAGLVVGAVVAPAMADTLVSLEATADVQILAGETASVSLTATGSAGSDLYNVAFRYELPAGVAYLPGSAQGADKVGVAEPKILTIVDSAGPPQVTHQVLIWQNLTDLLQSDSSTLTFDVTPDPAIYPVGSSFSGTAAVFAPSNPRQLVKFDSAGNAAANSYAGSDAASPSPTVVSAIEVTKSEPSPEHELMRGVHDQTTIYTIATRNTGVAPTNDVVVVDYLPAGLEFLGCGEPDNSTPGDSEEYAGSGRLGGAAAGTNCEIPVSVETVDDRPGFEGEVFTKVIWKRVALLGANETWTLTYAAGIPLFANAMWPSGQTPDAVSGSQGSNLDNNTGASTRQKDPKTGQALTNTVVASGTYTGPVAPSTDTAVSSTDDQTVRAMDLAIEKTGSSDFSSGQIATFTLTLRASEYANSSDMVITDTIPNGLCPQVPDPSIIENTTGKQLNPECQVAGAVDGATVSAVVFNTDGTFTLTLKPTVPLTPPTGATLVSNGTHTVTYTAFMGTSYDGDGSGSNWNGPTVAGDRFTNTVGIVGVTTDITGEQETGQIPVADDSKSSLGTDAPEIDKKILKRPAPGATAVDCSAADSADFVDSLAPETERTYHRGDTICFKLEVAFSTSTQTRNAVVTDFAPVGTTFLDYAVAQSSGVGAAQVTAVPGTEAAVPAGDLPASWLIGTQVGASTFVDKGKTLTLFVRAVVTDPSPNAGSVDITANLMKYRQESTSGTVLSLRDSVDFAVGAPPVVTLTKSVGAITDANGSTTPAAPANNVLVREFDRVTFVLDVTNAGSVATGNNVGVRNLRVWDALPIDYSCDSWSIDDIEISDGGKCLNPEDTGYPANSATPADRSVIVWTLPGVIEPGTAHPSLSYTLTIPADISVSSAFTNTASVVGFDVPTTSGDGHDAKYYPKDSLDPSTTPNAVPANDGATLRLADATVAKTGVSSLDLTNNGPGQAVAGEKVNYTYSVTVPAGSTVFNGVLSDALPAGLSVTASSVASASFTDGAQPAAPLPVGFALDVENSEPEFGTLTFRPTWDNQSSANQVFTVTLTNVLVGVGLTSGKLTNTATFASTSLLADGDPISTTATASIDVVVPAPTITKSVNKAQAQGGDEVIFTLVAANTIGRPAAFNSVVTDCLPAGLVFTAPTGFRTAPAGTVVAAAAGTGVTRIEPDGPPVNGCAVGTTLLTWTLPGDGSLLAPTTATITFAATVSTTSAGLVTYSNTATVTGSTLSANGTNDPNVEKVVSKTSTAATVSVEGATTVKTADRLTATIGESIGYTIAITIPKNVNFYNAAIIDTLPAGMSMDAATRAITCVTTSAADCMATLPGGGVALAPAAGLVGWKLGNLTANAEARIVTIRVAGTVTDVVANEAGVKPSNRANLVWNETSKSDPVNANDPFDKTGPADPAEVTIVEPSVRVAKSVSNTTPEPGEDFSYTITVTNANTTNAALTSDAHTVTVVDTIPAGIDLSSITAISDGGTRVGNTITWVIPTLAKNSSTTRSYHAKLAASGTLTAGQSIVNSVLVSTYTSLDGSGRVYGPTLSAEATVTPDFPHITLAKTVANGTTAYAGTPFGWRLTLTNDGRGTAKSVTASDVLPANWEYVAGSGTVSINGAIAVPLADPTVSGAATARTLVWAPFANVAPGGTIAISYTASPQTAALTTPGVGSTVNHTNTLSGTATDATGATGNKTAEFTGPNKTATAHIHSADLAIVKMAGADLLAGTSGTGWTLTVNNNGPDAAVGPITVVDVPATWPAGVTVTGVSGSTDWTCTVPSPGFTCVSTAASLASGAALKPIVVTVAVGAAVAPTSLGNTATVAAVTFDPLLSNNSSSAPLAVIAKADLTLVKTLTTTVVGAGEPITWHVVPNNLGPSVSRADITVTDVVPAGVSGVLATSADWDCDADADTPADAGDTITCTYTANDGIMPLGIGDAVVLTGMIDSSYTAGAIENTAEIAPGATTDPDLTNNESTTADSGVPLSNTVIAVEKTLLSPLPVIVPGDNAVYQITVTNQGPADARVVTISDVLPAGLTFLSAKSTTGTWTCDGTTDAPTVDCALTGTLSAAAASKTAVVEITVATDSSLTGQIVNGATASAENAPDVYDDTATDPLGKADLSIAKSHPAGAVVAGTSLDYTLTVTNNGPSDTPETIEVVDTVPVGLVPTKASGTDWDCVIDTVVPGAPTAITCELDGGMAATAVAPSIIVTVDIPSDLPAQTLVNTATVTGPLGDPTPGNNTATDPTVITTVAAVSIAKDVASAAPFVAGESVDYTVTVTNAGPSVANSVRVADVVPTGMTVTAISGTDWTCVVASADCTRAVLPLGTFTLSITATIDQAVAEATTLVNQANLTWTDSDGSHTDTDPADVTVSAVADLSLNKTAVDAEGTAVTTVIAGTEGRYLLQGTNHGPSAAVAPLQIVDQLPVGISYVGIADSGDWACAAAAVDADGQSVECALEGTTVLAAGADAPPLTLVVKYDAALPVGDLTNTAVVSSPTTDPDSDNNPAESVVTILQLTDLSITKTHTGSVRIGDTLAFDLGVTNAGPSAASGVTVTDTLPVGLDFVDAAGSDPAWSCVATVTEPAATEPAATDATAADANAAADAATTVTCVLTGDLAPGATAPALSITALVNPGAYPTVVNTASVASTTPESDPTNNTADDTVTVPAQATLTVTKTSNGTFMVGQKGGYTLTVTNAGPTEDPGPITLTDALPAGLTFDSATGTNVDCGEKQQVVTCTLDGALAVGETATIALTVNVLEGAYPKVVNSVQVESPTEQLPEAQLTDSDTTPVAAAPSIASTGFNGIWLVLLALLVLLLGGGLLLARRRVA
ncbi:hypothetical protein GCM10022381_35020 [Leifsonia kafniensis]|uniref:DUF11 domain-containing protein n=1 Tax=Leifsonia kafniensis TaxID=475957 RepID=A0ABP7KZX0_9MICO